MLQKPKSNLRIIMNIKETSVIIFIFISDIEINIILFLFKVYFKKLRIHYFLVLYDFLNKRNFMYLIP